MKPDVALQETVGMRLMRFMLITVALSSMSVQMFNIVIPQISADLSLSLSQVSWMTSGYILIYAFGTVTYGKLADRFQLKNILTFGLCVFVLGSLIGLFSSSFAAALSGRLMQAGGASVIPAMAMIIPVRYFAPERRGSAMSMTAIGLALGNVLGPVVSALILSVAHWRWLFVPPMLLLILLPFFRQYLNIPTSSTPSRFDWKGGVILFTSVTLILLGITYSTWLFALLGASALALFYLWIRYVKDPFIRPELFRNTRYRSGLLMTLFIACIANGLFYLSPVMFANVYNLEAQWIGYALIPAAIASALLGRQGGKLADRKGNAALYTTAAVLLMLCFILLSAFVGVIAIGLMPLILMFGNVGQTFMQVAVGNMVSTTLPKDQVGVGMGLFSMTNFIALGMTTGLYSQLAEMKVGWGLFQQDSPGAVFSSIYLVLALMHAGLLLYYRARLVKKTTA